MKKLSNILVAIPLYLFFALFAILPPGAASNLGGFIARSIGPRLAASRKARRNLDRAFPGISKTEQDKIIHNMWDNLGRVMAEYPHLELIGKKRVTINNAQIMDQVVANGQGGIFIAGHLANWEVHAPTVLFRYGMRLHLTYRAANNPYSDWLLEKSRTLNGRIPAFPKERSSTKHLMAALRDKQFLGVLIDQKYNEGVAAPFFGVPAMTNPFFVTFCQRYNCPLIPMQCTRVGPARFEMTTYDLIPVFEADGSPRSVDDVLKDAHTLMESWIRQNPGQWIWLHRRWDSKKLNP